MPTNILMPALSPTMEKGNLAKFILEHTLVMRGLDPCIHRFEERWIAGSSPAMTHRGNI